jgi:monofunctional biosynthetic peptidoglycan transglycosylase
MKPLVIVIILLLIESTNIMADEKSRSLLNFENANTAKAWVSVNDNVMGGISDGKFKITQDKTLFFYGSLSLANNGGFASVRCLPTQLALKKNDSICFQAKGDGREYTINLYTNKRLTAFSYKQSFKTKKEEWINLTFPLDKFIATSFGRTIPNAAPIDPNEINSIGFMIGDKNIEPFQLELKNITILPNPKE